MIRPRDNPFRIRRLHGLSYRFPPGEGWNTLLERLGTRHWRGALVGGPGRGKSTLLGEIGTRLEARGLQSRRLTLRRSEPDSPRRGTGWRELMASSGRLDSSTVLLLDGAEQLPLPAWWWLRLRCRTAAGLVVTSHRPGRLPTVLECRTTPEVLQEILDTLAPSRPGTFPTAGSLHRKHGGDLRRALFEAYDSWSRQPLSRTPPRRAATATMPQRIGTSQGDRV